MISNAIVFSIIISGSALMATFNQAQTAPEQHQNAFTDSTDLIIPGESLKLISSQFKFTEGPAADRAGNIYFTDQPNNTIWKVDTKNNLSLFMDKAGR
ncbi:MAG: hypothetical protein EOO02_04255, partial [Chitinophagaceae bacterium]